MMLYEELFIDGKALDIKGVEIERTYETPFFSDITKILSDSTKTIKLPETERNKAVMEYLHSADMNTDFPYTFHYADYYLNGMQLIKNGEVKVLGDFEIQIVYGINRAKYLPLKETKLNEMEPNGTTILESDWIVKWNRLDMYTTGKKYKYLDYVSGEREVVISTDSSGNILDTPDAPIEYIPNLKSMTQHPFVLFNDMLGLIETNYDFSCTTIKNRLEKKGLILGGEKDNYEYISEFIRASPTSIPSTKLLRIGTYPGYVPTRVSVDDFSINPDYTNINSFPFDFELDLNCSISEGYGSIGIYEGYFDSDLGVEIFDLVELITPTSNSGGYNNYLIIKNINIPKKKGTRGQLIYIRRVSNVAASYVYKGSIKIKIEYKTAVCQHATIDVFPPTSRYGRYNCLINLPDKSCVEFISDMLKMTGLFSTFDSNGDLKYVSLDNFKDNYLNGNTYDWSGKISNVRNSKYKFNSNAQKNWIKYENGDSVNYDSKGLISVSDFTIEAEKDLYKIGLSIADSTSSGKTDFSLYKQKISKNGDGGVDFTNDFSEKDSVCVYDFNGVAINSEVLPNELANPYKFSVLGVGYNVSFTEILSGTLNSITVIYSGNLNDILDIDDIIFSIDGSLSVLNSKITNINNSTKTITFEDNVFIDGVPSIVVITNSIPTKRILITEENGLNNVSVNDVVYSVNGDDSTEYIVINKTSRYVEVDTAIFSPTDSFALNVRKTTVGFINQYYQIYQKLINRPIVKEVDVLLDFYESSQLDFTKPIYIKEWGKYCMLLELNASNKGLSKAKLLLINQTL